MKFKTCLLTFATLAVAALPPGYSHWTDEQASARAKSMPAKMTKMKVATDPLGSWGNHSMSLIHREGSGEAELHETKSDILFIRAGEAAIIVGGTMPGAHRTEAHELRAPRVEGGEKQQLRPGDVIHIAPKTPHQVILEPGQKLDYYAVKVETR
jgi:mannose-6-phosphate isomerase-like protein (cupin superfamily)